MFKTKPRTTERRVLLQGTIFAMLFSAVITVGLVSRVLDAMFGAPLTLTFLVVSTLVIVLVGISPAMSKFGAWFMLWERKEEDVTE